MFRMLLFRTNCIYIYIVFYLAGILCTPQQCVCVLCLNVRVDCSHVSKKSPALHEAVRISKFASKLQNVKNDR